MTTVKEHDKSTVVLEGQVVRTEGAASRITDVKLLGYESRNGHRYVQPEAKLYEGVKVNLDHPTMFAGSSVTDTIGVVENVQVKDSGVWGDIVLNPSHPNTEQILWAAEHTPTAMGMSHVAQVEDAEIAEDDTDDGIPLLRVVEVISVDIVGRPATTKGFFEEIQENTVDNKELVERVETLSTENAVLREEIAVAAEQLRQETEAHQATKDAQVAEKVLEGRKALLTKAELSDADETFVEAVLNAETDEKASALIALITKKTKTVKSSEQTEETDNKDKAKAYADIDAATFAY